MKKILIPTFIALALSNPAIARTIAVQKQAALEGEQPITLHVDGGGVNLDLSQLNERIVEIILDDTSRVGYSHCLLTKSCGEYGMPNIHLRRIKTVDMPGIFQTENTLLTVNTLGKGNSWNTYLFPITLGDGSAPYNKISVVPPAKPDKPLVRKKRLLGSKRIPELPEAKPSVNLEIQEILVEQQEGLLKNIEKIEDQLDQFAKERDLFQKDQDNLREQIEKLDQKASELEADPQAEEESQDLLENQNPSTDPSSTDPVVESEPVHQAESSVQFASTLIADQPALERKPVAFSAPKRTHDNALTMGLSLERRDKKVSWWQTRQINTAIILLRRGLSLDAASRQSGVTLKRLTELIQAGGGAI